MWGSVKTRGLILSTAPWKEADRKYRALTADLGKIEFIGRGARKGKAKLAAHLEPFCVVDLEIVRGARQMTVIGVERHRAFPEISGRYGHRALALAMMDLADAFLGLEDPHTDASLELTTWLEFLNTCNDLSEARAEWLLFAFALRLFEDAGLDLSIAACLQCREGISPLSFRWHGPRGGLVCTDCTVKAPQDWAAAVRIPEESVVLLRFAKSADLSDLLKVPFTHEALAGLRELLLSFAEFHAPLVSPRWPVALGLLA